MIVNFRWLSVMSRPTGWSRFEVTAPKRLIKDSHRLSARALAVLGHEHAAQYRRIDVGRKEVARHKQSAHLSLALIADDKRHRCGRCHLIERPRTRLEGVILVQGKLGW